MKTNFSLKKMLLKNIAVCGFLMASASSQADSYGPNLVLNPGFEGSFTSWNRSANNTDIESTLARVISETKSLRLSSAGDPQWGSVNQVVNVVAGKTYRFMYTGRVLNAAGPSGGTYATPRALTGEVRAGDAATGTSLINLKIEQGTDITVSGEFTVPEGVTQVYIRIIKSYGICYADNVTLQKKLIPATLTSSDNFSTIAGSVTKLNVSNGATLTVNQAGALDTLIMDAGTKLDIANAGLTVKDVILRAGKTNASSVTVSNGLTISGNVNLEKTIDNQQWYFVSFPSDVAVGNIVKVSGSQELEYGVNWLIKYYDGASRTDNLGAVSNWKDVASGATLLANKGYIIRMANAATGDYVLSFPLNKALLQNAETDERTVAVVAHGEGVVAGNHVGWNLVGVPYVSNFAGTGVGANFLTFWNGTTYDQLAKGNVASIQPYQAFFVQASAAGTTSNLLFANSSRQSVSSASVSADVQKITINISNAGGSDATGLILGDSRSEEYEINQDLEKWLTTGTEVPQIYTLLNGVRYAFNALPADQVKNLPLVVYTKNEGVSTIKASVSGLQDVSALLLYDKTENKTIDLLQQNYSYDAAAGLEETRFELTAQKIMTHYSPESLTGVPHYSVVNGVLRITNLPETTVVLSLYDTQGRLLLNQTINGEYFETQLPSASMVLMQLVAGDKTFTGKILTHK